MVHSTFSNVLFPNKYVPKLCNGCSRDSQKDVRNSQKFSEVMVGLCQHEWDIFPASSNYSLAAKLYLNEISFAERFFLKQDLWLLKNRSQLHTFQRLLGIFSRKKSLIALLDAISLVYQLYLHYTESRPIRAYFKPHLLQRISRDTLLPLRNLLCTH